MNSFHLSVSSLTCLVRSSQREAALKRFSSLGWEKEEGGMGIEDLLRASKSCGQSQLCDGHKPRLADDCWCCCFLQNMSKVCYFIASPMGSRGYISMTRH